MESRGSHAGARYKSGIGPSVLLWCREDLRCGVHYATAQALFGPDVASGFLDVATSENSALSRVAGNLLWSARPDPEHALDSGIDGVLKEQTFENVRLEYLTAYGFAIMAASTVRSAPER